MAQEDVNNRLQVGVGFKIDDIEGGLANLATNADKISTVMEQLAKAMGNVEKGSKGAGEGTKKAGRGFSDVTKILNEYKAGVQTANQAISKLQEKQEELKEQLKKIGEGTKEYDKIVQKLAKVNTEISKIEKQKTRTVEIETNKQKKIKREAEQEERKQIRETTKLHRQELQKVTTAYKQAMNERKASSQMLGQMLNPVNADFSNRLLTSAFQWTGAYALVREFQNLGREIVDIEYNTVNNMRLMGDFSAELRESLNASAAEIARNTGVLITDAQNIQGAWIRINEEYAKSPELLGKMAEITSKFMNVGEIEDAESAVKLLNSTLLQFNLNTGDVAANVEEVANKFAYMADVTSMGTADEYAEGIAKMGANVKNMSGDVDDAIVLLSIVGDKLAKNGAEAGNSLNTFTAYMHRMKTINLFDDLQSQMLDLDVTLRDGENGLKNFEDSLTAIAAAYQRLKAEGNQTGMNQIIEALGATRQRATAQAILDAISDGETLDKYYGMLANATATGNYLEEQNAALMDTLANQFNSLVATLQEAGMYIANSGLIDGLTLIMNGFEGLVRVVTKIPQPLITLAGVILSYKTALAGLNKIGEVTGLNEKLAQAAKFGGEAMVEQANSARTAADDFLNYQKSIFSAESASVRLTDAYQSQLSVLASYEEGVARANMQLAQTGNVQKYTAELDRLKAKYLENVAAVNTDALTTEELNAVQLRNEAITRSNTAAQVSENSVRKANLLTLLSEQGLRKADNTLRKLGIDLKLSDKIASMAETAARKIATWQTESETRSTIANTVAKRAGAVATWGITAATTAFGVALNFLLSPMVLITGGIALLTTLFNAFKEKTIDYTESLNNLQSALQTGRERVQELQEAQAKGGNTEAIQKQIDKQEELNASYEKSIKLIQQKQNYESYFGDSDEDNESEKIKDNIRVLQEYGDKIANVEERITKLTNSQAQYEARLASGEELLEHELYQYATLPGSIKILQNEYAELDRNAGAAAGSLYNAAQEIQKMRDDGLINDADWGKDFQPLIDKINECDGLIKTFVADTNEGIASISFDTIEMGDLLNQMDSLAESTKSLVEAQNQLAKGAALSKDHLWELAMQYPELLYQANLFADGSVSGQEAAINAILDMKNQEFNNAIDLKITELEADKAFITDLLNLEEQKLNALVDGEKQAANGKFEIKNGELAFLTDFNNLEGQQVTAAEQYKAGKYVESASAKVDAENQANEKVTNGSHDTGEAIANNLIEGSAAGADGAKKNASNVMSIFNTMLPGLSGLAQSIMGALGGNAKSIWGNVNTVDGDGDRSNSFKGTKYTLQDIEIDGKTVTEWIDLKKEEVLNKVESYTVTLQGIDTAISNLESFKNIGLSGVSNKYSDKGAQGGTGKSGDAEKAANKAADASEKAAKEAQKAAEAIEKIAKEYVKNVESLQDRIAKALKKQYQDQYDERKKLLEREHEERVSQIQAEIDALNGNTAQDKQSELERLQEKYNQWSKDDSTLGKAKQKEYLDQIEELEKEIKIDELEQKLDEENDKYQESIDKDSEFYDAILKKLDQQMTDEALYREANDMIRNGKIQEITDLLTKYDAQWDGWATLMGKTAGEIIGEEVALAIANYLDVMKGTITEDGGSHTNAITGGNSSVSKKTPTSTYNGGSSGSTGTSGGSVSTGSKVKINDTSTGMYYTSTSSGAVGNWSGYSGSYYVVNSNAGRVALARDNNINNAIGWISKNKVTKLATGGYTGNYEGLAYLHSKERVLSARQTAAFENFIYNQLPRLERQYTNIQNNGGVVNNFNKELVSINVDNVNNYTPVHIKNMEDNIDRMFRVSLQKAGIRKPR